MMVSRLPSLLKNKIYQRKGEIIMAKYVCSVCGYVHEGDQPPEKCPQCGVGPEKFNKMEEGEKSGLLSM